MADARCDVLVVGGGLGGVAAALGAASLGARVILTEETDWLGGQVTVQAVPTDEHPWIERFGRTRRYQRFREGVRNYYRHHYPLLPASRTDPLLNPGEGQVSPICCEPRVALAVIDQLLAADRQADRIDVRYFRRPVAVTTKGDRVESVTLEDPRTGARETITAPMILDATETGELLPLAKVEYVSGAESKAQTGEAHAEEQPQPENVQSFTWCFPMAHDPGSHRTITPPEDWTFWRDYVPSLQPAWSGKLLDWSHTHPVSLKPYVRVLMPEESTDRWAPLWLFRRIVAAKHYPEGGKPHEVTLVNWPQNDYWEGNIIDKPADHVAKHTRAAKQLSLSLLYWLQTEAPRTDGGKGYPGLYLRPDLTGTEDGLAKAVYIRESRRIKAVFTVTEAHVGTQMREGKPAEAFADSVGTGSYRIDLHPSCGGTNYIDISSLPFQIPLGALLPVRVENLIPACKNLGVTHITNGCYRLHPVEWNIGESAGLLAAFALKKAVPPKAVRENPDLLKEFQGLLDAQGVERAWPVLTPR